MSQLWRLETQDQSPSQFSLWHRLSSWLADRCLLAVCSYGLSSEHVSRDRSKQALFHKNINPIRSRPTLMTSFNLNYFPGGPFSKYRYTWGLGFQHMDLGWGKWHKHSMHNRWVQHSELQWICVFVLATHPYFYCSNMQGEKMLKKSNLQLQTSVWVWRGVYTTQTSGPVLLPGS